MRGEGYTGMRSFMTWAIVVTFMLTNITLYRSYLLQVLFVGLLLVTFDCKWVFESKEAIKLESRIP